MKLMTIPQLSAALRLARAFGHEWAQLAQPPRAEWEVKTVDDHAGCIHSRAPDGCELKIFFCSRCGQEVARRRCGNDAYATAVLDQHEEECWSAPAEAKDLPLDVEGIEAATDAVRAASYEGFVSIPIPGLSAPAWGPAGFAPPAHPEFLSPENLVHCTGSGRTCWAVRPDGSVFVEITRPAGPVLRFTVPALAAGTRVTPMDSGALTRHWDAAREVCRVLGAELVVPADIAAVWAAWRSWGTKSAEGPEYYAWVAACQQREREVDDEIAERHARLVKMGLPGFPGGHR